MIKLLNPVKYFTEKTLLTANLVLFSVGTILAILFKVRFDGVLDLHFMPFKAPIISLTDNIVNIVLLAFMLFILGKNINPKTRMVDCLNTAFVCRIPMYLLSFLNISGEMSILSSRIIENLKIGNLEFTSSQYFFIILIATASILAIVVKIILLFNGFKVASNAKTTKHYVLFFVGLIVVEILSKIILSKV